MKIIINLICALGIVFHGQAQILKKAIPNKLVVLTFDDAPASHYSTVAPLLQKFGFGATFFVCEFPPNFKDSTLYMNWRQIRALADMGFEIANHTRTHANVTKLSQVKFAKELDFIDEKCDSLQISKPMNFAYPGYGLNSEVLSFLNKQEVVFARAGGSRAYDPLTDHPYLIPSWAPNADNKKEILAALEKAHDGKIVILTFHGVPDVEHPWVTTPLALFKEYLDYLAHNGYKVIALKDLEAYVNVGEAKNTIVPDLTKELTN